MSLREHVGERQEEVDDVVGAENSELVGSTRPEEAQLRWVSTQPLGGRWSPRCR